MRKTVQLLIVLLVAFAVFAGAVHLSDAAAAASYREQIGGTRGPIVDAEDQPVAFSSLDGSRHYTLPGLANAIGYRDPSGRWHGLESTYDGFLDAKKTRNDWRTFFLHLTGKSASGGTVHLTLDPTLQRVASAALGSAMGAVLALDPQTGAILADVSKPSCTADELATTTGHETCANQKGKPLLDRVTQFRGSPGSSFKIVTLSAAIDSGTFTLGSVFTGADIFGPSPYFDGTEYPSNITSAGWTALTTAQALAFSDNFTFAHIGLTLGSTTWLEYAHRFGLDAPIGFNKPVPASTVDKDAPLLTNQELAQAAFGADDVEVSPLQMALIASTVANGGVTMAPHLVSSLTTSGGKTVWTDTPHQIRRVMSEHSAEQVADGMRFAVNHGSGYKAQIQGVAVSGKTGTADSGSNKPNAWFIAFAPQKHPVIALAVLKEFSGEGADNAAPIARKVLVAALNEHGFHLH